MATSSGRGRAQTESFPGAKPKIDVLIGKQVGADMAYLIRVREDFDTRVSYYVKRMKDFFALDAQLKAARKRDATVVKRIPPLPAAGSVFGVRRRLSGVGLSPFLDKQAVGLQQYCRIINDQISNINADTHIEAFFADTAVAPTDIVMRTHLMAAALDVPTLETMKGHWKLKGSVDDVWTIEDQGKVLLNGEYPGEGFELLESGKGWERKIERADGWTIDLARSSADTVYWTMPGTDVQELCWLRTDDLGTVPPKRRSSGASRFFAPMNSHSLGEAVPIPKATAKSIPGRRSSAPVITPPPMLETKEESTGAVAEAVPTSMRRSSAPLPFAAAAAVRAAEEAEKSRSVSGEKDEESTSESESEEEDEDLAKPAPEVARRRPSAPMPFAAAAAAKEEEAAKKAG